MENYSTTQAANITAFATILVLVAQHFKVDIQQGDLVSVLSAAAAIVAVVANYVNRFKKGDLKLSGIRK